MSARTRGPSTAAQPPKKSAKGTLSQKSAPVLHYRVELADLHAHLFTVTMSFDAPADGQMLHMPVWIPGSYLVREFAKHVQGMRATQNKRPVTLTQVDKSRWQVACKAGGTVQVAYEVYAFDSSVRTACLDAQRGFFNGTSLFLRAQGLETLPHRLEVIAPPDLPAWQLATALTPVRVNKRGFGTYCAANYDALVDCPVEMGMFWSGHFKVGNVVHRVVVSGAPDSFDGAQLLADTHAICAQHIHFWHGGSKDKPPFDDYLFLLNTVHDGYGGLEHRNSTALICPRKDLPRSARTTGQETVTRKPPEGYTSLLGLISHEYFHTWNVKRLRPAAFAAYDYTQENYTDLLWFFEGFTSYYDDLMLRRARRIDNASYLKLLGKTINQVLQTPGRRVQTVAQASFDAWIKYYRQDENSPNATVSYYTKGALVGLCLDLSLRLEGKTTLDAVMRGLWKHCGGGAMTEEDLLQVLQSLSGRSYAREITRWVHSTEELPLSELLEAHGVQLHHDADPLAQQLGLRVKEIPGIVVQQVLRGGAAEKAGFASGDEWLAVQTDRAKASGPWRMHTLDDLLLYCGNAKKCIATVARDKKVLQLALTMPKPSLAVRLSVRDASLANRWLDSPKD